MKDVALRELLFTAGIIETTDGKLRKVVSSDGIKLAIKHDAELNAKYNSLLDKIKELEERADSMIDMIAALCDLIRVDLDFVPSSKAHYKAKFRNGKKKR